MLKLVIAIFAVVATAMAAPQYVIPSATGTSYSSGIVRGAPGLGGLGLGLGSPYYGGSLAGLGGYGGSLAGYGGYPWASAGYQYGGYPYGGLYNPGYY